MSIEELREKHERGKAKLAAMQAELGSLESKRMASEEGIRQAQITAKGASKSLALAAESLNDAAAVRAAYKPIEEEMEDNLIWRDALRSAIQTKNKQIAEQKLSVQTLLTAIWEAKRAALAEQIGEHAELFKAYYVASIKAGKGYVTVGQQARLAIEAATGQTLQKQELEAITGILEAEIGL